jgi:hypothetical protein
MKVSLSVEHALGGVLVGVPIADISMNRRQNDHWLSPPDARGLAMGLPFESVITS